LTGDSNWFVFFVVTGKEDIAKTIISNTLKDIAIPFVPTIQELFKTSKKIHKREKTLFPGYVFVESLLADIDFYYYARQTIFSYKEIISILRYAYTDEFSIREDEKKILSKLCNRNFCIESSSGIIIGDNVYIREGPLMGLESTIKKINRHKREAVIEMKIMGEERLVKVSLEIIEKV